MGFEVSFEGVHSTAGSNIGWSSKCAEPRLKDKKTLHLLQILTGNASWRLMSPNLMKILPPSSATCWEHAQLKDQEFEVTKSTCSCSFVFLLSVLII